MSLAAVLARAQHILLDFDGPMCSTFSAISAAEATHRLGALLARHGVRLPDELLDSADPFALLHHVAAEAPQFSAVAEQSLTELEVAAVRSAEPTPGLREMLDALHCAGRSVTVVSNNSAAAVCTFVVAEDLVPHLHGIVARADPDPRLLKPSPFLPRLAAAQLRASVDTCALLGDSVTDIEAARRAGVGSIAFANKPGKHDMLLASGPNAIVASLFDVVRQIKSLGERKHVQ